MMQRIREILGAVALMSVLAAGCGTSPPTNFYILNAVSQVPDSRATGTVSVGVGPVELPAYADRPEMVTREGSSHLRLAEFDQWAEPLRDSVVRVLTDNLSNLLTSDQVHGFPWDVETRYQVSVDVARFDAEGQNAVLIARWILMGPQGGEPLQVKRTRCTAQADLRDYSSIADALSDVLGQLSDEIAAAITSAEAGG